MIGYSDRINHAFAFAAKLHDRQVRKGTRLPYLTHPANVAVILTRYGCDEDTVIAGILHHAVEDCLREGWTREMLEERFAQKFGVVVLETALAVVTRKNDDDGVGLDDEGRRSDYLRRLVHASDRARWVCTADKVHDGSSILADLKRTIDADSVWGRFSIGRDGTVAWYRAVFDRLREVGFTAPIVEELRAVVELLHRYGGDAHAGGYRRET